MPLLQIKQNPAALSLSGTDQLYGAVTLEQAFSRSNGDELQDGRLI